MVSCWIIERERLVRFVNKSMDCCRCFIMEGGDGIVHCFSIGWDLGMIACPLVEHWACTVTAGTVAGGFVDVDGVDVGLDAVVVVLESRDGMDVSNVIVVVAVVGVSACLDAVVVVLE